MSCWHLLYNSFRRVATLKSKAGTVYFLFGSVDIMTHLGGITGRSNFLCFLQVQVGFSKSRIAWPVEAGKEKITQNCAVQASVSTFVSAGKGSGWDKQKLLELEVDVLLLK